VCIGQMYRLKAVVYHVGQSAKSGHYVAAVSRRNDWLLCDDMKVLPTYLCTNVLLLHLPVEYCQC